MKLNSANMLKDLFLIFHHRGMPILDVDLETQTDLKWSARQPGSGLATLILTKIRTDDPLPMIPHQVETQYI